MGQLTITLSDDLEKEVRSHVKTKRHNSVSDFVRDAITNELSLRPSYWERFIVAHVLENNKMLKQLTDSDWGSEELLEGLKRGYIDTYADATQIVDYGQLSKEDSTFVRDVLDMFAALQSAVDKSGSVDSELQTRVNFKGFDGNSNDGYLAYTNHLVDNGYYTDVRPLDKTPHLNSHTSSSTGRYKRMLSAFRKIQALKNRRELSIEDVKIVLDSEIHP